MNPVQITIDFETRSEAVLGGPGKPGVGAWAYSQHPTTEVICMAYKLGEAPALIWINPKFCLPEYEEVGNLQLVNFLQKNRIPVPYFIRSEHTSVFNLEAHNAAFERAIWLNIMVPKFGWSVVPLERWRCSAAKCSASALPRSLEKACEALDLSIRKDKKGHNLMSKMCKPRAPRKAEKIAFLNSSYFKGPTVDPKSVTAFGLEQAAHLMPTLWHEEPQQFLDLFNYNIQDVESQYGLSQAVRDLDPEEQQLWVLDQQINERGFCVDTVTINAVLEILAERKASLLDEVDTLTEGKVQSPQQTEASLKWLAEQGTVLPNMQADTIKEALGDG